jgi:hypothetical protein
MRSDEEIIAEFHTLPLTATSYNDKLIIELLLDIRSIVDQYQ